MSLDTHLNFTKLHFTLLHYTRRHIISSHLNFTKLHITLGARGGAVVEALCYKPEGRGFDSRWCHWNFSLT
jgi:hypothetical protein